MLGILAVACTTVVATASAASGSPQDAAQSASSGVTTEYVVAYSGSEQAATAAIQAAGGSVKDVTAQVGLALVTSTDGAFMDKVRTRAEIRGAAKNHSVGTSRLGMPHRFAGERLSAAERAQAARDASASADASTSTTSSEPLAGRQWDMRMIDAEAAQRTATGKGVDVASSTPASTRGTPTSPRTSTRRSPATSPPTSRPSTARASSASCKDPANVDNDGHGTHVAGTIAAADNGFGIGGVAPDATLVNVRAGQDSGYFFLYETVKALVYAGDIGLDVVNMSFYTDPWLYNCTSRRLRRGTVTDEEHGRAARSSARCCWAPWSTPTTEGSRWSRPPGTSTPTSPHRPGSTRPARTTRRTPPGRGS